MHRYLTALLCALLLAVSVAPVAPTAQAQPADERFFEETRFRIDNDAFWNFFNARGGIRTFGYPVSREFRLQGFPVQIFQRIVMQLQPDGSVATLNLLDEGLMPYTQINFSTFPAPDPALPAATPVPGPGYDEQIIEFVRANAPDEFEGEPVNFLQTFLTTVTLEDAFPPGEGIPGLVPLLNLELWGAPTSQVQRDPANANFIYLRFQRGIMHYDADCPCTQGLLLADYLKSIMTGEGLPPDLDAQAQDSIFYRQYAPGQPGSLARPDELPATDLTDAFEPQQPLDAVDAFGYGLQAHLWHFGADAKSLTAGLVSSAGFNWLKHQVEWSDVERAPGVYDWGELDSFVDASRAQGLNVMLSVVHAPEFHRSPASGLMPADPGTFQSFMQAVAGRYQGRVQAYELWNEQNLDRETGPGNVSPANYLQLLRAGHIGTKAGDPGALTLFGALSPTGVTIPGNIMDDLQYLEEIYAINNGEVRNYFDALGAHPSGFSNPPDCTPATPECSLSGGWNNHDSFFAFHRTAQYRDVMVRSGDAHKQIWFTEFGYGSTDQPVEGYEYAASINEQQQGQFLVRAFEKARDLDYVGGMIVWNLNYQIAVDQADEKWAFGLIRSDWSPRPAFTMLANMPKH